MKKKKLNSIENKIKRIILSSLTDVDGIIIYGSAAETDYKRYNDIDIMVITKKKLWKNRKDKNILIEKIKNKINKSGIKNDLQIYSKITITKEYCHSPNLLYQFLDYKIIYGKIKIPKKQIELYSYPLARKIDCGVVIIHDDSSGRRIYKEIRNAMIVRLLMNGIIDKNVLEESIGDEIGERLARKLKNNRAKTYQKRIALAKLRKLVKSTDNELLESKLQKVYKLKNPTINSIK